MKPTNPFREPMVWLMTALPAAALIAGVVTYVIAATH